MKRILLFVLIVVLSFSVANGQVEEQWVELSEIDNDTTPEHPEKKDPDNRGKRSFPLLCRISSDGITLDCDRNSDDFISYSLIEIGSGYTEITFYDDVTCARYILQSSKSLKLIVRLNYISYEGIIYKL